MIITRFPPSPTGYLHLGSVRTALFNYLFARNYEGKFILRIEDTDDKRLVEASIHSIVDGLQWLGIEYDGEMIIQSDNIERHKQVAEQMIEEKKAYRCYCTQEELDAERDHSGLGYKYSGKCKRLVEKPNTQSVIRLSSESFDEIKFHDLITGEVVYHRDNLDDFIIIRSDGMPTYMFAVVVDDHDEGVTHIIRGNDHHTNTAKQLMVYKLMEWDEPEFAHIPLILSEDGAKMSKRKHAVDIMEYKNNGFLPQAMVNYLMLLGWTPSSEIISLSDAVKEFGLGRLHKSPARFDMKKLRSINAHYLTVMANENQEELINLICENYSTRFPSFELSKKFIIALRKSLVEIVKRAHTLVEIIDQSYFYFDDWRDRILDKDAMNKFISNINEMHPDLVIETINKFKELNDLNHDSIENLINELVEEYDNLKKSDIMKLMRMMLTGTLNSYSIIKIIEILGGEEVLNRLSY